MDQPCQARAAPLRATISLGPYIAEGSLSAPVLISSFLSIQRLGIGNFTPWFLPAIMVLYFRLCTGCIHRFMSGGASAVDDDDDPAGRAIALVFPVLAVIFVAWYSLGAWLVLGHGHTPGPALWAAFAWLVLANLALCAHALATHVRASASAPWTAPDLGEHDLPLPTLLGPEGRAPLGTGDKHEKGSAAAPAPSPQSCPPKGAACAAATQPPEVCMDSGAGALPALQGLADGWGCRRRRPMGACA